MTDRGLLDFATWLYAQDGISTLCLDWQDRFGVDVNVLLFSVWAAAHGQKLSVAGIGAAAASTAPWRTGVIEPLRCMRRRLKHETLGALAVNASHIRDAIKAAELEAEYVGLRILEQSLPRNDGPLSFDSAPIVAENIEILQRHYGIAPEGHHADVRHFVSAVAAFQS
jgi:uncharacterized protein (TIGR02444 family)